MNTDRIIINNLINIASFLLTVFLVTLGPNHGHLTWSTLIYVAVFFFVADIFWAWFQERRRKNQDAQ